MVLITIPRLINNKKGAIMGTIRRNVVIVAAALHLLGSAIQAAQEAPAGTHSDNGDCSVCHVAPESKLRGWFVSASTKKEMKDDLNTTCRKCHPIKPTHAGDFFATGAGHATGKTTSFNRDKLPMAPDGTIACAITCHNMHVTSDDPVQQSKHLRLSPNVLCRSCHNI
jgi:hypothetical protein